MGKPSKGPPPAAAMGKKPSKAPPPAAGELADTDDRLMESTDTIFSPDADLCQQLLDRYAASSAPHHRHLCATAAAMRSILSDDSLPLSPLSYFAVTMTAASQSSDDASSIAALTTFLSILLPIVPPGEISPGKAAEAVVVLVSVLERPGEAMTTSSARCLVKCLGVLVGFCDLEDWNSVKLPVRTLLRFCMDKRPKVRKCAQVCLVDVLKSFQSPSIVKKASKLVLSLLRSHMPSVGKLGSSKSAKRRNSKVLTESENLEALHVLNIVKIVIPHLNANTSQEAVSELLGLLNSQHLALARPVLETTEALLSKFGVEVTSEIAERSIAALSNLRKCPKDTILVGVNLLSTAINVLQSGETSVWVKHYPVVVSAIAGVLTLENDTASQASYVLKDLIDRAMDRFVLSSSITKPVQHDDKSVMESSAITSICSTFDDLLAKCSGGPNEHILSVLSVLFLKLGVGSYDYMGKIVSRLAEFMRSGRKKSVSSHLHKCMGCAVASMGPENILKLVPISLDMKNFTCSNTWLLPILKNYIYGASLSYFMGCIVPLADSITKVSLEAEKKVISQDLQAQARGLWGLLPAFCRHPVDLVSEFESLAKLIVVQLEKDSSMLEDITIALQELVKQNGLLNRSTDAAADSAKGLNKTLLEDSLLELKSSPSLTKKVVNRNIKAVSMGSRDLLPALVDVFLNSPSEKRTLLKDAIRCLVSISEALVTRKIFISSLVKFNMVNIGGTTADFESPDASLDEMSFSLSDDVSQRCLMLELVSSIVTGAEKDLVGVIFRLIKNVLQEENAIVLPQAYFALSQILEEHSWFCSVQFDEVVDMLLGLDVLDDVKLLHSRLTCFHILLVHALKDNSDEEYTKAFRILNEIILTLKESKEEVRKTAYDSLLKIGSTLFDSSGVDPEGPYYKLVTMMMGYLSGSSPQITSGAVSALSMLLYKEPKICLYVPDLVSSVMNLLLGKSVEIVKSALGFVKVLVSCVETKDLQTLLPQIADAIFPWAAVSRHHFRSKVIVILEIMVRKCGPGAVEAVTPGKYHSFMRKVLQNRHGKNNSMEAESDDVKRQDPDRGFSSNGRMNRDKRDGGGGMGNKSMMHGNKWGSSDKQPGRFQNSSGGFKKRPRNFEQDPSRPQKKFKQSNTGQKRHRDSSTPASFAKGGNRPSNPGKHQRKDK